MRNSIFLKTIAILLCAASLTGIIGSTAGVILLTQNNLYNQSVEDLAAERVRGNASDFANQIAYRYADQILGGCPVEISRYGSKNWLSNRYQNYGYSILDAEGTVLESLNPELKDSTLVHTIPVTGQYMHLVSLRSDSQAMEESAQKRLDNYESSENATVPAEGISINHVFFTDADGQIIYEATASGAAGISTYYYRNHLLDNRVVDSFANSYSDHNANRTGFLFHNPQGKLTYSSFLEEQENAFETTVYGVLFHNEAQGFTYRAEDPAGLGTLSNISGYLLFTASAGTMEVVPEETVPETLEETQPAVTEAEKEAENEIPPATEAEKPKESNRRNPGNKKQQTDPAYFEELSDAVYERVFLEWMLHNGVIVENEIPEDVISDQDLKDWLVHYQIIDADQELFTSPQEESAQAEPAQTESVVEETVAEETIPQETLPEVSSPVMISGKPLESYQINQTDYFNNATGERTTARYIYLPMPELTVEVYLGPELMKDTAVFTVLHNLQQIRSYFLPTIVACLLLFILTAVYLFISAGCSTHSAQVRAGGINRMPLDLYLVLSIILGGSMVALAIAGVPTLLNSDLALGYSLAAAAAVLCCLLFVGFFFALAAQCKTGGGFWWRQTLSVRLCLMLTRSAKRFSIWLKDKALLRFAQKVGHVSLTSLRWIHKRVQKFFFRTGKLMDRFFSLIPLTWQWLVCGIVLLLLMLIACTSHNALLILICLVAAFGILFYGTHCFGVLLDSARKMGKGNLDAKADERFMIGCFWDFARELNNLAQVTNVAAQKQLASERMKTELITNVSHDIKTPLTSIINYVDLLQKPHSEAEGQQYLEVLDRQSQRLKKLVDDLMDMSKASTGNMDMEITKLDMVEAVNQALGEFAGKLDQAQLYPVFRHSESCVPIMADGKLVWRVLSNILSNVVKYAMPRTRIYLDLTRMNGKVFLSLKNISKEPLNINAEELMERFVRGDISRNTDGSGLGLNIAKSLMELQKGQLHILVDGDLFKVTLIFPDNR